jgi:CPA2 family monovalent cation:H+ antiporter-2
MPLCRISDCAPCRRILDGVTLKRPNMHSSIVGECMLQKGYGATMRCIDFIHDLAIIMLIAGVVTVLFHRLKQPVVLGYIVAGGIIGPHTPPSPLISGQHTTDILAELGVIFLMFSLGLEFSLRKLRAVGATVAVAGLAEIVLLIWIGFEIGRHVGWKSTDTLFLSVMMAIFSTTIIARALDELGLKREGFAQNMFGILVVEDILAICTMVLLTGLAVSGNVSPQEVALTFGKLTIFLVVSLVVGLIVVPRLLDYVARAKSNEILLIGVLGICFGFCLLVIRLGYSVAMAAFVIAAVMAEARAAQYRSSDRTRARHVQRDLFSSRSG